jgi:Zn-dependent peptidase ImmA (M78 family)
LTYEQLSEIRANNFAAAYLLPYEFLQSIPENKTWNNDKIIKYSKKMHVNPESLSIGLLNAKLISEDDKMKFSKIKIESKEKLDSELPLSLSIKGRERKVVLLEKGLSDYYVNLCFEGYREGIISQGRLAEMLLCNSKYDLLEICSIYNQRLNHGD